MPTLTETEYSLIPTKTLNRMIAVLEKVEPLIKEDGNNRWVDADAAMKLLHCKRTKLYELCRDGSITYKTSGNGRNVRYCRKSINLFNSINSSK